MKDGQWSWNYKKDGIWDNEYFDTEEEAIFDARDKYKETDFWVGQISTVPFPQIDAESVTEQLACQMYEEVGEAAEDFLRYIEKADMKELGEYLNAVIAAWVLRHKYDDEYFTIYKARHVVLKEVSA